MTEKPPHLGTLAAIVLARLAFGYQAQTVATLGPLLRARFQLPFSGLGTLIGLYMLPGIVAALPAGFLARRFGDRVTLSVGLMLMSVGSGFAAFGGGPTGIGAGRVIAGTGAVALTVLQSKIIAERFSGRALTAAIGLFVGAFPVGIGLAQIVQTRLASGFGWPAAFLSGAALSAAALGLLLAFWQPVAAPVASTRAWPTRRERRLCLIAGLTWTLYNASFANFFAYLPSLMHARGHTPGQIDLAMAVATWAYMPAILAGGRLAGRFGASQVFAIASVAGVAVVGGTAGIDAPLLSAVLFGTFASMQAGLIIERGTLSSRPEHRAVGMALFYTAYYLGGTITPAICGKAADLAGSPAGAFIAAAAISALALPSWFLHARLSGRGAPVELSRA